MSILHLAGTFGTVAAVDHLDQMTRPSFHLSHSQAVAWAAAVAVVHAVAVALASMLDIVLAMYCYSGRLGSARWVWKVVCRARSQAAAVTGSGVEDKAGMVLEVAVALQMSLAEAEAPHLRLSHR